MSAARSTHERRLPREPLPTALAMLVAVVVGAASIVELRALSTSPSPFRGLEGWFYPPTARAIGPTVAWLTLATAAVATAIAVARTRAAPTARLALLIAAGVAMLVGFALIEDRGLFAIRDRMLNAGHAEFARTAAGGVSARDVLHRYEALVSINKFGPFERTKPPGTLLFYVLTERLAHRLLPFRAEPDRLQWLATMSTFLWPLVSMLSLAPLYAIGRALVDVERALWACALAIVVPSFLLITMHTDQVLFPLVVNAAIACATLAAHRDDLRLGVLAGVLGYAAIFCSFGLVAAAPIVAMCIALGAATNPRPQRAWLVATMRASVAFVVGVAMSAGVAIRALHYDLPTRYEIAIHAHLAWKGWTGTEHEIRHFALLNALEFGVWLGAPIAALLVVGALVAIVTSVVARRPEPMLVAVAVLMTVCALAWFGRTKAESARLWLFLAQPACLAASVTIDRLFPKRGHVALAAVLILQFAIVLDIKRFQDFW